MKSYRQTQLVNREKKQEFYALGPQSGHSRGLSGRQKMLLLNPDETLGGEIAASVSVTRSERIRIHEQEIKAKALKTELVLGATDGVFESAHWVTTPENIMEALRCGLFPPNKIDSSLAKMISEVGQYKRTVFERASEEGLRGKQSDEKLQISETVQDCLQGLIALDQLVNNYDHGKSPQKNIKAIKGEFEKYKLRLEEIALSLDPRSEPGKTLYTEIERLHAEIDNSLLYLTKLNLDENLTPERVQSYLAAAQTGSFEIGRQPLTDFVQSQMGKIANLGSLANYNLAGGVGFGGKLSECLLAAKTTSETRKRKIDYKNPFSREHFFDFTKKAKDGLVSFDLEKVGGIKIENEVDLAKTKKMIADIDRRSSDVPPKKLADSVIVKKAKPVSLLHWHHPFSSTGRSLQMGAWEAAGVVLDTLWIVPGLLVVNPIRKLLGKPPFYPGDWAHKRRNAIRHGVDHYMNDPETNNIFTAGLEFESVSLSRRIATGATNIAYQLSAEPILAAAKFLWPFDKFGLKKPQIWRDWVDGTKRPPSEAEISANLFEDLHGAAAIRDRNETKRTLQIKQYLSTLDKDSAEYKQLLQAYPETSEEKEYKPPIGIASLDWHMTPDKPTDFLASSAHILDEIFDVFSQEFYRAHPVCGLGFTLGCSMAAPMVMPAAAQLTMGKMMLSMSNKIAMTIVGEAHGMAAAFSTALVQGKVIWLSMNLANEGSESILAKGLRAAMENPALTTALIGGSYFCGLMVAYKTEIPMITEELKMAAEHASFDLPELCLGGAKLLVIAYESVVPNAHPREIKEKVNAVENEMREKLIASFTRISTQRNLGWTKEEIIAKAEDVASTYTKETFSNFTNPAKFQKLMQDVNKYTIELAKEQTEKNNLVQALGPQGAEDYLKKREIREQIARLPVDQLTDDRKRDYLNYVRANYKDDPEYVDSVKAMLFKRNDNGPLAESLITAWNLVGLGKPGILGVTVSPLLQGMFRAPYLLIRSQSSNPDVAKEYRNKLSNLGRTLSQNFKDYGREAMNAVGLVINATAVLTRALFKVTGAVLLAPLNLLPPVVPFVRGMIGRVTRWAIPNQLDWNKKKLEAIKNTKNPMAKAFKQAWYNTVNNYSKYNFSIAAGFNATSDFFFTPGIISRGMDRAIAFFRRDANAKNIHLATKNVNDKEDRIVAEKVAKAVAKKEIAKAQAAEPLERKDTIKDQITDQVLLQQFNKLIQLQVISPFDAKKIQALEGNAASVNQLFKNLFNAIARGENESIKNNLSKVLLSFHHELDVLLKAPAINDADRTILQSFQKELIALNRANKHDPIVNLLKAYAKLEITVPSSVPDKYQQDLSYLEKALKDIQSLKKADEEKNINPITRLEQRQGLVVKVFETNPCLRLDALSAKIHALQTELKQPGKSEQEQAQIKHLLNAYTRTFQAMEEARKIPTIPQSLFVMQEVKGAIQEAKRPPIRQAENVARSTSIVNEAIIKSFCEGMARQIVEKEVIDPNPAALTRMESVVEISIPAKSAYFAILQGNHPGIDRFFRTTLGLNLNAEEKEIARQLHTLTQNNPVQTVDELEQLVSRVTKGQSKVFDSSLQRGLRSAHRFVIQTSARAGEDYIVNQILQDRKVEDAKYEVSILKEIAPRLRSLASKVFGPKQFDVSKASAKELLAEADRLKRRIKIHNYRAEQFEALGKKKEAAGRRNIVVNIENEIIRLTDASQLKEANAKLREEITQVKQAIEIAKERKAAKELKMQPIEIESVTIDRLREAIRIAKVSTSGRFHIAILKEFLGKTFVKARMLSNEAAMRVDRQARWNAVFESNRYDDRQLAGKAADQATEFFRLAKTLEAEIVRAEQRVGAMSQSDAQAVNEFLASFESKIAVVDERFKQALYEVAENEAKQHHHSFPQNDYQKYLNMLVESTVQKWLALPLEEQEEKVRLFAKSKIKEVVDEEKLRAEIEADAIKLSYENVVLSNNEKMKEYKIQPALLMSHPRAQIQVVHLQQKLSVIDKLIDRKIQKRDLIKTELRELKEETPEFIAAKNQLVELEQWILNEQANQLARIHLLDETIRKFEEPEVQGHFEKVISDINVEINQTSNLSGAALYALQQCDARLISTSVALSQEDKIKLLKDYKYEDFTIMPRQQAILSMLVSNSIQKSSLDKHGKSFFKELVAEVKEAKSIDPIQHAHLQKQAEVIFNLFTNQFPEENLQLFLRHQTLVGNGIVLAELHPDGTKLLSDLTRNFRDVMNARVKLFNIHADPDSPAYSTDLKNAYENLYESSLAYINTVNTLEALSKAFIFNIDSREAKDNAIENQSDSFAENRFLVSKFMQRARDDLINMNDEEKTAYLLEQLNLVASEMNTATLYGSFTEEKTSRFGTFEIKKGDPKYGDLFSADTIYLLENPNRFKNITNENDAKKAYSEYLRELESKVTEAKVSGDKSDFLKAKRNLSIAKENSKANIHLIMQPNYHRPDVFLKVSLEQLNQSKSIMNKTGTKSAKLRYNTALTLAMLATQNACNKYHQDGRSLASVFQRVANEENDSNFELVPRGSPSFANKTKWEPTNKFNREPVVSRKKSDSQVGGESKAIKMGRFSEEKTPSISEQLAATPAVDDQEHKLDSAISLETVSPATPLVEVEESVSATLETHKESEFKHPLYRGESASEAYKKYPGHPLVGVYNIKTKEITLMPCIVDSVEFVEDKRGNFVSGWRIDKELKRIEPLESETFEEYKKSGFAPRTIVSVNGQKQKNDFRSSHQYMLGLMKENANKKDFRGFSVTPGDPPKFAWVSGALNSPRDEKGKIIERVRGAKMEEEFQQEVRNRVTSWVDHSLAETKKPMVAPPIPKTDAKTQPPPLPPGVVPPPSTQDVPSKVKLGDIKMEGRAPLAPINDVSNANVERDVKRAVSVPTKQSDKENALPMDLKVASPKGRGFTLFSPGSEGNEVEIVLNRFKANLSFWDIRKNSKNTKFIEKLQQMTPDKVKQVNDMLEKELDHVRDLMVARPDLAFKVDKNGQKIQSELAKKIDDVGRETKEVQNGLRRFGLRRDGIERASNGGHKKSVISGESAEFKSRDRAEPVVRKGSRNAH